jgi:cytochrome P450
LAARDSINRPSPQTLPIVPLRMSQFAGDVLGTLLRLHDQFGPLAAIEDGDQRLVFLFDPALNHQVLRDTQTYNVRFFPIRGPKRSSQRRLTCGLLGMNGPQHVRNRRIVKEPFGLRAISSYRLTIEEITDRWLDRWQFGTTIDLADEMTRYMLAMTSSLLFGMDDYGGACRLGEQIAEWVALMHDIGVGALVPDDAFGQRYEELLSVAESLEVSVTDLIARRRQTQRDLKHTPRTDVLSLLLRGHAESEQLSDEELIGQTCVLFGAAHMTTAHSLTWTLLLLMQHPHVAREVYRESLAPGEDSPIVLQRAIKESMRVLPASAYSQRITNNRVKLGPLECPRGTPVVFTPLITHRLPELYANPRRFDPDRWLSISPSPYEYLPFGGGSRMCIGGPLAMEILRIAVPRMLLRFGMQIAPHAQIDARVHGTMLGPVSACPVELREADGEFQSVELAGNLATLVDFPPPEHVTSRPRQPR